MHTGEGCKNNSLPGIMFNTDGISPFKSSLVTIWPMIIALTNLPPNIRMNKDNLVTVAIWAGESKPPIQVFFKSLKSLLDELETTGVAVPTSSGMKTIRFRPVLGLFDLIAKAPILSMNQFNGVNGCPTCLHPGVWTTSRYYLPGTPYPLRTNASVVKAAEDAIESGGVVEGIKGKSVLSGVVDLVDSIPVDYMHCVLEGVTKWLMEKWFASCNHRSPFYIGTSVRQVDTNLLHLCPPHDFSRAPRSIQKHRKYWKASEFRNWLLYYSLPLLCNVLPPLYLHHYSLLVCGIHILLQSKLTLVQVQAAEEMLNDFYHMLPELYGPNSCTLNAHSLTHLTKYVRLWGPLWVQSLFGFESMNGHIVSMIHSRRKIAEQLSFSIDICHTVGILSDKLLDTESDRTLSFLGPLSSNMMRKNMSPIIPGVYAVGYLRSSSLTNNEISAISELTHESTRLFPRETTLFKKVYIHGTLMYTNEYGGKRDSSICCFTHKGSKQYGIIQKFILSPPIALVKPFKKTTSSLLKGVGNPVRARLSSYARVDLLSSFIVEVHIEPLPLCAIFITSLLGKCVCVSSQNSVCMYIAHIPNNYEHH